MRKNECVRRLQGYETKWDTGTDTVGRLQKGIRYADALQNILSTDEDLSIIFNLSTLLIVIFFTK